jgi:hypothetical protein
MIEMPEAFHTATDDLAFADDWASRWVAAGST